MRQGTETSEAEVKNYDYIVWGISYLKGRRCRIDTKLSELLILIEIDDGTFITTGYRDIRKAKSDHVAAPRRPVTHFVV